MCLGVPGEIIELLDHDMARIDVNGNQVEISIVLTPNVQLGQFVMVHAGFAIEVMDKKEASESLALMLELQKIRESQNDG